MLPKLTEMERNWVIFIPPPLPPLLWFYQKSSTDPSKGEPPETHGKIQSWQYYVSKITWLVWSKMAKRFSVNPHEKFPCQYQASKHLASSFPFSGFYILSSFLGCYFNGISCTFCFNQMFNGFLTSVFDFCWSLAHQFSCITIRFSQSTFLFAVLWTGVT